MSDAFEPLFLGGPAMFIRIVLFIAHVLMVFVVYHAYQYWSIGIGPYPIIVATALSLYGVAFVTGAVWGLPKEPVPKPDDKGLSRNSRSVAP
jgi:hypothetical protein